MSPENTYEQVRVGTFKTSTYRVCRPCAIAAAKRWQTKHRERQLASGRASRRRTAAAVKATREAIKAQRAADRAAARLLRQEAELERRAAAKRASYPARHSDPAKNWSDHLKRRYRMTVADYDRQLAAQGGGCAICEVPLVRGNPNADNAPHVDHCHATHRVRGILCRKCNLAVGYLRDDPARARGLAAYLERSR